MSPRNNEERLGGMGDKGRTEAPPVEATLPLSFSTPTEFVELPSQGEFYPEGHPLHGEDTIEIRYMTAKDEDILSSKALLKKGIAIDRLLERIIIDKRVKPAELLIGDKNALIVAARISGYGSMYDTKVTCPTCSQPQDYSFTLENLALKKLREHDGVTKTDNGTFMVELPLSRVHAELRLLTGHDERKLFKINEGKKKHKLEETPMADMLKLLVVSLNGIVEPGQVNAFLDSMPALDSRHIRSQYKLIAPNVDFGAVFQCDNCDYLGELEVPLTADFFWPG